MHVEPHRPPGDRSFLGAFIILGGGYMALIIALVAAEVGFARWDALAVALARPEIRYAVGLSLATASLSTLLALWVAVPLGYLMSRTIFAGKGVIEAIIDVPIVLPPMVVGLALLLLFQTQAGQWFQAEVLPVSFQVSAVVLAQFTVISALAARTMRVTFDQIDARAEAVACTLGCSRGQAFWAVTFPQARRGILAAGTLAWARAFGEFGPVLVFAGTTRMRTEVLPTSVYLELNLGRVESAVAVSLMMLVVAAVVLGLSRLLGARGAPR